MGIPPQGQLSPSWSVRDKASAYPSTVRVKNLRTSIHGVVDAWDRGGRTQPLTVSVEISLRQRFDSSSASDNVLPDTVHYGLLSKEILAILGKKQDKDHGGAMTLSSVFSMLWSALTGLNSSGGSADETLPEASEPGSDPFLDMSRIGYMSLTLHLPKATLVGEGVSFTGSAVLADSHPLEPARVATRSLRLHLPGIRVPTLIGVNENERLAKQVVMANVEIDQLDSRDPDIYPGLEQTVIKTMSDSSFETLEALATRISRDIAKFLKDLNLLPEGEPPGTGPSITIELEKPVAVPLADTVSVELRTDAATAWYTMA